MENRWFSTFGTHSSSVRDLRKMISNSRHRFILCLKVLANLWPSVADRRELGNVLFNVNGTRGSNERTTFGSTPGHFFRFNRLERKFPFHLHRIFTLLSCRTIIAPPQAVFFFFLSTNEIANLEQLDNFFSESF